MILLEISKLQKDPPYPVKPAPPASHILSLHVPIQHGFSLKYAVHRFKKYNPQGYGAGAKRQKTAPPRAHH
jgi:hypothetical protein